MKKGHDYLIIFINNFNFSPTKNKAADRKSFLKLLPSAACIYDLLSIINSVTSSSSPLMQYSW